MCRK
jgi:hypothetical protein